MAEWKENDWVFYRPQNPRKPKFDLYGTGLFQLVRIRDNVAYIKQPGGQQSVVSANDLQRLEPNRRALLFDPMGQIHNLLSRYPQVEGIVLSDNTIHDDTLDTSYEPSTMDSTDEDEEELEELSPVTLPKKDKEEVTPWEEDQKETETTPQQLPASPKSPMQHDVDSTQPTLTQPSKGMEEMLNDNKLMEEPTTPTTKTDTTTDEEIDFLPERIYDVRQGDDHKLWVRIGYAGCPDSPRDTISSWFIFDELTIPEKTVWLQDYLKANPTKRAVVTKIVAQDEEREHRKLEETTKRKNKDVQRSTRAARAQARSQHTRDE